MEGEAIRMENIVETDRVGKTYRVGQVGVVALKNISLQIPRASFTGFIGPSGSGKTTLLNLIGCLDTPTTGTIRVAGKDVTGLGFVDRARFRGEHIGFIFQDFNLIPVLTVFENVEYPLLMVRKQSKKERRQKVEQLLESVGILEQKEKLPTQLSGGQKQRVAIARALTTEPVLVLADEPTANLDHDTAYKIIGLMKKLRDLHGTSFIFSTHDTKIVSEVDMTYTLEDGEMKGSSVKGGKIL